MSRGDDCCGLLGPGPVDVERLSELLAEESASADAMIRAAARGNAAAAGQAADLLRSRGMSYVEIFDRVREICPKMSIATWDRLLLESEEEG